MSHYFNASHVCTAADVNKQLWQVTNSRLAAVSSQLYGGVIQMGPHLKGCKGFLVVIKYLNKNVYDFLQPFEAVRN